MHEIWFHRLSSASDSTSQELIVKSFLDRNIAIKPLNDGLPFGIGLVLFDQSSEELLSCVKDFIRHGFAHVIAIALKPASANLCTRLLASGVHDVLEWTDKTASIVQAKLERSLSIDGLMQSSFVKTHLAGHSQAWTKVLRKLVEIAYFTTSPVLITGQTGTGKEVAARLIHALDTRPQKKQLVTVDCTTLTEDLAGSELFGHERGSFTSAIAEREGAIAQSDGGTLFLDELGELPPGIQASLLRATQEHTYKRIGSNTWQRSNFRLVSATNRDLRNEIEQGSFRGDFYHRIATWHIQLPSLAERREDIIPIAKHFLLELRPDIPTDLDAAVSDHLLNRSYAGNIRELKQVITRMALLHVGSGPLTVGDIPFDERQAPIQTPVTYSATLSQQIEVALNQGITLKELTKVVSDTAVDAALQAEGGNVRKASQRLGITDRALQLRLAERRHLSGDTSTSGDSLPS